MTTSSPSGIGFAIAVSFWRLCLSRAEVVFVEAVHEGIVSGFRRVRRDVYAERDTIAEREPVSTYYKVLDSR